MTLYDIGLFLHVFASLALFGAIGIEWVGLIQLRKAETAESVRAISKMIDPVHRVFPMSGGTLLISGIYMSVTSWGFPAWIVVSLALLLALAATGPSMTGNRLTEISRLAASERGKISPKLRSSIHEPFLFAAHQVRMAITVGIVFLMCVKPALIGTIITIVASAIIGLLWSLPTWATNQPRKLSA